MAAVKGNSATFTPEQEAIRAVYKRDRLKFFRECLRVKDRQGNGLVPFEPLEGQVRLLKLIEEVEEFYAEVSQDIGEEYRKPIDIQILKARRGGFSTLIEALMFHYCEFNASSNGLVVAHQASNADNVLQISRRFATQIPDEFKQYKVPTAKLGELMEWGEANGKAWDSRIVIATANSRNFARGFDFNFIHLSECAHYSSGDAIASAKDAALFAKYIFEESTANGMDAFFHKSWQQAKYLHEVRKHWKEHGAMPENWNGKLKFFFAWHDDSAYRIAMSETAKAKVMLTLTDQEKEGVAKFGWRPDQIEWRRRKIAGDCSEQSSMEPEDYFRQEYPSSPEEAFVFSGKAVFPLLYLESVLHSKREPQKYGNIVAFDFNGAVLQKPKIDPLNNSTTCIWEEPKPQHQYIVSAKPGYDDNDNSVVLVFDRTNGAKLVEVAAFCGKIGPVELGDICLWLGLKYHSAFMIPEATRAATAQRIAAKGYPFLYMRKNEEKVGDAVVRTHFVPGFRAVTSYRDMVIDLAQDAFHKDEVGLRSPWLAKQMSMFSLIDGERRAPSGESESGVISACLAVFAHRQAAPKLVVPEDLLGERVEDPLPGDPYERHIAEKVREKKKIEEKRNKRLLRTRELNATVKLKNLFK